MIERKILIGLIVYTGYLKELEKDWNPQYLESSAARMISGWCWEYFNKYGKAPNRNIELIYMKKLKRGIDKDLAEEIEQEILPSLSQEYENENLDVANLLDETKQYFIERQITLHKELLEVLLEKGKVDEAQKEIDGFKLNKFEKKEDEHTLDLSDPKMLDEIDQAFNEEYQNVIKFPGALGSFWNDQLVRGGLVALLAPEKRGKTFWLLEFMMRAYKQGRKVAFFQAGDMTKRQQIKRICIYLANKSDKERYCGIQYVPVQDCIKNQSDTCQKKIRESSFGITLKPEHEIRENVTITDLIQAGNDFPKYKNCYNCHEWTKNQWGTVWFEKKEIKTPLTNRTAKTLAKKFFIDSGKSIKLSTYANGTLSINKMEAVLDEWKEEGFEPEVILVDYPDIMEPDKKMEFRHQENEKWKGLRKISQERDCLVIAPTQADAQAYDKDTLGQKNFSEDKRKYAHVTAMYGLNQDKTGREKKLGVMRINKLVVREDEFTTSDQVYVLQKLSMGRPFLGSFF